MLKVIPLANTFAIIDLIAHSLFHIWVSIAPNSYEWAMNVFVAGLHLEVTGFDTSLSHILIGVVLEAIAFWILGAAIALIYNRLARS